MMPAMRLDLLKSVLAVPTVTDQEHALIEFLEKYFQDRTFTVEKDYKGNLFVTRGRMPVGGYYPLVCAHTDSVHALQQIEIKTNEKGHLYGVNPRTRERIGCGGDDKAGVFICLELLDRMPCLKAAFFVGEEHYCIGSRAAGPEFFQDVGYCIEFDSPQGNIVSYSCDGTQLFEEDSEFARIAVPIMDNYGMTDWQRHPYTDVAVLKRRFDFACVNLPAGYYCMHTSREYVNPVEVDRAVEAGAQIITQLGLKKYEFMPNANINETKRKTTGLVLCNQYGF